MAVQKSKTLSNGITGNYWRITEIVVDRDNLKLQCRLSLYVNKESRESGCKPLEITKVFSFITTKLELDSNLTELGYKKIKEKANTPVPSMFSKGIPQQMVPGDADLVDAIDV